MDDRQPTLTERVARLERIAGPLLDDPRSYGWVDKADQQEGNAVDVQKTGRGIDKTERFTATDQCEAYPSAFDEIISRIQGSSERVCQSASAIETISARIMGTLPEKACGADEKRIEPDGTLDKALTALNRLDASLARLETATLRMERL